MKVTTDGSRRVFDFGEKRFEVDYSEYHRVLGKLNNFMMPYTAQAEDSYGNIHYPKIRDGLINFTHERFGSESDLFCELFTMVICKVHGRASEDYTIKHAAILAASQMEAKPIIDFLIACEYLINERRMRIL